MKEKHRSATSATSSGLRKATDRLDTKDGQPQQKKKVHGSKKQSKHFIPPQVVLNEFFPTHNKDGVRWRYLWVIIGDTLRRRRGKVAYLIP